MTETDWRDILCCWIGRLSIVKIAVLLEAINVITTKDSMQSLSNYQ